MCASTNCIVKVWASYSQSESEPSYKCCFLRPMSCPSEYLHSVNSMCAQRTLTDFSLTRACCIEPRKLLKSVLHNCPCILILVWIKARLNHSLMYVGSIYQGLSGLRGEQGPPGPVGPPGGAGTPVSRNTNFSVCICPPVSSISVCFRTLYSSLLLYFREKQVKTANLALLAKW